MGQLILVRHGQASFGADDYDVLSATGWAQGRALGAWWAQQGVRPTAYVRGGMRRHRETLEALADGSAAPGPEEVTVDQGWDEFDHVGIVASWPEAVGGARAGAEIDRRDFQRLFERATNAWIAGEHGGTGLETYAGFAGRVRDSLARATAAAGSGESVVVVTSGGPIAIVAAILADPDDEDPARLARRWQRFNTVAVNAAWTRVVVGASGARLLTFNEHPHLAGDLLTYR